MAMLGAGIGYTIPLKEVNEMQLLLLHICFFPLKLKNISCHQRNNRVASLQAIFRFCK